MIICGLTFDECMNEWMKWICDGGNDLIDIYTEKEHSQRTYNPYGVYANIFIRSHCHFTFILYLYKIPTKALPRIMSSGQQSNTSRSERWWCPFISWQLALLIRYNANVKLKLQFMPICSMNFFFRKITLQLNWFPVALWKK